ncbi:hypothetical protein PV646_28735 [Streptomyces sp. ID05-26A]|nr:hypothetical protein [Streptomyces sp. ID05-26A]
MQRVFVAAAKADPDTTAKVDTLMASLGDQAVVAEAIAEQRQMLDTTSAQLRTEVTRLKDIAGSVGGVQAAADRVHQELQDQIDTLEQRDVGQDSKTQQAVDTAASAQAEAYAAQDAATTAIETARAAQAATTAARDAAVRADASASSATAQATTAAREAGIASNAAHAAQQAAEAAARLVDVAAGEAAVARAATDTATQQASASRTAADQARTLAEQARGAADQALTTAATAAQTAADAKAAAANAATNAQNALTTATAAQTKADHVATTITALEGRIAALEARKVRQEFQQTALTGVLALNAVRDIPITWTTPMPSAVYDVKPVYLSDTLLGKVAWVGIKAGTQKAESVTIQVRATVLLTLAGSIVVAAAALA